LKKQHTGYRPPVGLARSEVMSDTPYNTTRADFCAAFDVQRPTFDRMVDELMRCQGGQSPCWDRECAAEALREWAITELHGEGFVTFGWDLTNPLDVAELLTEYSAPRIWAALLGKGDLT